MILQQLSNKFAWMSLVCAVLVTFIHVPVLPGAHWLYVYFSHGLGKIAVPYFFVAAGFFFAGHIRGGYRCQVGKRVWTLLVPMLIWDVLYYVAFCVILPALSHISGGGGRFVVPSVNTILRILAVDPFHQPFLGVFWFTRVLFILVLLSPLFARRLSWWLVLGLWMLNGIVYPDYGVPLTRVTFTLQEGVFSIFGAAYFSAGVLLRRHVEWLSLKRSYGLASLSGGIALLLLRGNPYSCLLSRTLSWFSIPFLMVGVWVLMPKCHLPSILKGTRARFSSATALDLSACEMLVERASASRFAPVGD